MLDDWFILTFSSHLSTINLKDFDAEQLTFSSHLSTINLKDFDAEQWMGNRSWYDQSSMIRELPDMSQ
jgi:hypothetical protein